MAFFGSTEAYNKSVQKTQTAISQISNQKCLNICSQENTGNTVLIGVEANNINAIQRCNVSGASCILKSSLSASIVSNQSSDQKAKVGFLSLGNADITNDNYQSITSNTSQYVNETCGNRSEQSNSGNYVAIGVKANNINVGQLGFAGHSGCVLNNVSRALTNTSQENSQSATRGGLGGIIGIIFMVLFIGGFIWLLIHMHKSHSIATAPVKQGDTTVNETTVVNVEGENQTVMDSGQQSKYKAHIDSFATGSYVVLFFALASLGTSIYFFIESYTAKKECYGKVSNGAPRPTSTNSFGVGKGTGCVVGTESECYVPLLPDGSRAYNPYE